MLLFSTPNPHPQPRVLFFLLWELGRAQGCTSHAAFSFPSALELEAISLVLSMIHVGPTALPTGHSLSQPWPCCRTSEGQLEVPRVKAHSPGLEEVARELLPAKSVLEKEPW